MSIGKTSIQGPKKKLSYSTCNKAKRGQKKKNELKTNDSHIEMFFVKYNKETKAERDLSHITCYYYISKSHYEEEDPNKKLSAYHSGR